MLARPRTHSAVLSAVPGAARPSRLGPSEGRRQAASASPRAKTSWLTVVPSPNGREPEGRHPEDSEPEDREPEEVFSGHPKELERWIDECQEIERAVRRWLASQPQSFELLGGDASEAAPLVAEMLGPTLAAEAPAALDVAGLDDASAGAVVLAFAIDSTRPRGT